MCFAYMFLVCIFNESKNKMLKERDKLSILCVENCMKKGLCATYQACSSVSATSSSKQLAIRPGFTTTQSDQWRSALTGIKMSFFWNTLMFFFEVQDATDSGPSFFNVVMKCDVKKWTLESELLASPRLILHTRKKKWSISKALCIEQTCCKYNSYQRIQKSTRVSLRNWPGHSLSTSSSRMVT